MNVEVKDIHFSYGKVKALDGVDIDLPKGAIGLLGPNGAGKSTLLRILLGFLTPDRGEGSVLGYDIKQQQTMIRRYVGYMPEDDCFIPGMDAVSFTSYMGELSGMPRQEAMKRAHEVLFYVGLEESRYRKLETYSSGMRQRLKLAQALVHDPKLIFLDEPTSGLDPHGRKEVLELIMDISSKKDIQVLISSHILPDIEQTCSYVVILNKGKTAAQGQISELKQVKYSLYELKIKGDEEAFLEKLESIKSRIDQTEDKLLRVYLPPGTDPQEIFKIAAEREVQIRHFVKSQTSLEDLFAQVVGVD
ncbi:MAG: ABC transporter ATP-binding protein [Candidatus Aminicenantes bacterium]|jgi:ABC-2 type transport system ATP-binding protein|nr:ABC transporter ATP-binding protein [Candidatus Aminicenantes bacterium]MDH5744380.1 ABC transporter ATP-binding protein [Candidatus Aminicenantes bacterium]